MAVMHLMADTETSMGSQKGACPAIKSIVKNVQLLTGTFLPLRPCSLTQTPLLTQS